MTDELDSIGRRRHANYDRKPRKGGRTANGSFRIRPELQEWIKTRFNSRYSFNDWLEEKIEEQRQLDMQLRS